MRANGTRGMWFVVDALGLGFKTRSSSFTIEAMDLLKNLHLKQDQFFSWIQHHLQENQYDVQKSLNVMESKVEYGFIELHSRLNTMKLQLNEIQQ